MNKKKYITLLLITFFAKSYALVGWGGTYVIPHTYGAGCSNSQYVEVGFFTIFETNNASFQIQRSKDPNFSSAIVWTPQFDGNIDGCGTCGESQHTRLDYGPFVPGEVWYYRVKATSNSMNYSYKDLGVYSVAIPTVINWESQVTNEILVGTSPATESSYHWAQETRDKQGVVISLMPTEISKIYLEQNNATLKFEVVASFPFLNLEVNVDNGGYTTIYNGQLKNSHTWSNSSSSFAVLGNHNLKVRFTDLPGTIYYREYDIYVVPKSDGLYIDEYCNSMRVWKGSDPVDGIPLIVSEGFDSYNATPEQFYREAGKDLISCLLNKGFNIYIINYSLNTQSIRNNAAIFQSAIRYISSINGNKKVVAGGMSMGGVINRYACAKAEQDGTPLPISKMISMDAPHQGAVISSTMQDWRKEKVQGDVFAEHALNNTAAKELLIYNSYDPSNAIHTNFYNELNSLNGDGYPHLVESIGVSFSSNTPNPNSGKWLHIHISGLPANLDQDFNLTPDEMLAGSFYPRINADPMPVSDSKYWALVNTLRPFSSPSVSITQYLDPTFIPHNSALDLVNGVSKFDRIIKPAITTFHDVIPGDIIQPIINAIIEDNVYIQNKTYTNVTRTIIAGETMGVGNNVTATETAGDVNINSGSVITFKSANEIQLKNGVSINSGSIWGALISEIYCDGNVEYQKKMLPLGTTSDDDQNNTDLTTDPSTKVVYYDKKVSNENILIDSRDIKIYPNPNNGKFKLNITGSLEQAETFDVNINIYNSLGALVYSQNNISSAISELAIDLESEKSGIYIIQMIKGTTSKTIHFIKE